jgi:hypothetical protein
MQKTRLAADEHGWTPIARKLLKNAYLPPMNGHTRIGGGRALGSFRNFAHGLMRAPESEVLGFVS